jgi:hypothetical protein
MGPGFRRGCVLSDIRRIPGGFEARIAFSIGLGNGKLPSSRASGTRSRRLMAPTRRIVLPASSHTSPFRRLPHLLALAPHAVARGGHSSPHCAAAQASSRRTGCSSRPSGLAVTRTVSSSRISPDRIFDTICHNADTSMQTFPVSLSSLRRERRRYDCWLAELHHLHGRDSQQPCWNEILYGNLVDEVFRTC